MSITWLIDAYMLREKSIGKRYTVPFEQFLSMTRRTKRHWITQAKRSYLDGLKRIR